MSTTYLSVDYFPLTVNFFDRDAIELAEAKYGIRVDGAVCKLLCKIFKEGYYIPWGEEQSLIFARKLGGELKGKEIDGIIQILLDKGFFDKESYEKFQILTSLEIQHIWIDATCRRKRKLEDLPYLLVNDTQKQEKENNTKDANNSSVQGELKLENDIPSRIINLSPLGGRQRDPYLRPLLSVIRQFENSCNFFLVCYSMLCQAVQKSFDVVRTLVVGITGDFERRRSRIVFFLFCFPFLYMAFNTK